MAWPSIAEPNKISGSYHKRQLKGQFESGRTKVRALHTSGRWRWNLRWDKMSAADLALLVAAFEADAGSSFSWTHPISLSSYTVFYGEDEIQFEADSDDIDYYGVDVVLWQE